MSRASMAEPRNGDRAGSRPLVPTDRELDRGVVRTEGHVPEAPRDKGPKLDLLGAFRNFVKDLNPRSIVQGRPVTPIAVLSLSAFVVGWDVAALGVLLPEMRADFAFDLTFLFTLSSILGTVTLVLAPLMGYLADRVKRVWMLRLGSIVANASSMGLGFARTIPQLVMTRVGGGIGGSVANPAGFPLLSDIYPSKTRTRVFAFLSFAGLMGGISGNVLAGYLGSAFGWRPAAISLGALATLVSFGTFLIKEPKRGYQDRIEMGASEEAANREQEPVSWSEGWRAARSISTVRRLWFATPFLHAGGAGVLTILGLYYAEVFGLGAEARGFIGAIGGVVGLMGLVLSGPIGDRVLARRPGRMMTIMGALLVVQAISLVALSFSGNFILSVAVTLPITFTSALFAPALFTLISLTVPARIRGLGLQTIAPWQILGNVLLAFVGAFAGHVGLRPALLLFMPFFLIAAAILGTAASGVERDIRAANAASLAGQEAEASRASGRSKMIVCRDVDVEYEGVQVLFGVDLDVEEGEIVALLGTNGAGKSTLIRAICGIQEASNGAIFLDGQDITHVPPHENAANGVIMLPGGRAIFPTQTVAENLKAASWMYRKDEAYVSAAIDRVHGLFPVLAERADQRAGDLSGGEQQMLALSQALIMKPRLLMIDELSLGLAPAIVERLLDILRRIHDEGTTIVLVEQSINVALTIAERAVFMEKGEVTFDGPTSELLERSDVVHSVFLSGASAGELPTSGRRAPVNSETVLAAQDVSVTFGGVQALRGASVEIAAGEIVGIIGPNGAGKTTLFDAITGYITIEEGVIKLEGTDVTRYGPDSRARLGLGRSFQNAKLFPNMTARESIAVAHEARASQENPLFAAVWTPKVRKIERSIYRKVDSLIATLGLDAYAEKFVGELSTATRRIVDIACVMSSAPKVLLLDEPSSGLAQAESEELGPVLQRLVRETGCGLLVIEHDIPLIVSISDRLVAMELGSVLVQGPPSEVIGDEHVIESYLGTTQAVIDRSTVSSTNKG